MTENPNSRDAGDSRPDRSRSQTPKVPDLTSKETTDDAIRSTRRFDLRRILGALFLTYGVIVTLVGIVNHSTDGDKTGGIQINLWTGGAMLVAGLLFLLWDRLAPVPADDIVTSLERQEDELKQQD